MQISEEPPLPQLRPLRDRLLVVDCQRADADSLRATLEKLGFDILHASNSAEALSSLAASPPDLILIHLRLPDVDGIELCRRIQLVSDRADIPIVFLSQSDDKELIVRALEAGGMDYLVQPFHKSELLSRVRTQLMLKTTRDHLRQMAMDKEEIMDIISHHLQNRLAALEMNAQLLADRARARSDCKDQLLADNICGAASHINLFIKSLLANARADRGFTVVEEPVDFAQIVGRAVARYRGVAVAKELHLRTELAAESVFIHADPAALDQVLDNLLSNAVKFSPPGGEVVVSLERTDGHVECRVRDQGPGLSAEDHRQLYHRFARLSARPTGGEPSTGLGLSIAKRLMDAMNGELVCVSEPGKGATFIIRFPIQTHYPSPEQSLGVEEEKVSGGPPHLAASRAR